MPVTETAIQIQFFDYLFGIEQGYVCICTQKPRDRSTFTQYFFAWPAQRSELAAFIQTHTIQHNLWFCVNLLSKPERKKEFCLPANLVWADLDTCNPQEVEPMPQCIIESSPDRWQAIWRLDGIIDPYDAEAYSKKLAYKYNQNGADPSGWDLTQLLRIPLTFNYKYDRGTGNEVPRVNLIQALEVPLPSKIFDLIEAPENLPVTDDVFDEDMPDLDSLPPVEAVIYKYAPALRGGAFVPLYDTDPGEFDDWSKLLWRLINICIEAGMDEREVFALALVAKCNKYKRDNRPAKYLWREVKKAAGAFQRFTVIAGTHKPIAMPTIITEAELESLEPTIISDYHEWAIEATDAVPAFHDLCSFILLSTITASSLRLMTSYGPMVPNLWGLILGDSTLTRKTTAMRMATDFLVEIDRDLVLATDGSIEGVLSGLSTRPNRVSMFFKDEVSGFLDSINRKEYLAGMQETLTQLYDVPEFFTRRLRKETINIVSPVFIFFGGGIRDKVYTLITDEHITSGFLPRFLIVSGDADLSQLRRTGPNIPVMSEKRTKLLERFADLYENYGCITAIAQIGSQQITLPGKVDCFLSNEAWERYGQIEEVMVRTASESPISMFALPTFERLSRSLLKMSVLLAASRQTPTGAGTILVEAKDVLGAARYVQDWGRYTIDLISNSGRGVVQRQIDKILKTIENTPGIPRSRIMQLHHLTKREMDEIQNTLEDRRQIRIERKGKGTHLWAT